MKTSGARVHQGSKRFLRCVPVLLLAAIVATATLGDLRPQIKLCAGVCSDDATKTCVTSADCPGAQASCVDRGVCSNDDDRSCASDGDCPGGGTCERVCDAADERLQGSAGDFFGFDVRMGDVCDETRLGDTSEGFDDVIVGSPEEDRVYIFCGSLKSRIDQSDVSRGVIALNDADIVIEAGSGTAEFGFSVAATRTGTGPSPLIIGAPSTDVDDVPVAYVIPASALQGKSGMTLSVDSLIADGAVKLQGATGDQTGYAVTVFRTTTPGASVRYAVSARAAENGRGVVYYFQDSDLTASPVNLPASSLPRVQGTRATDSGTGEGGEGLGESLAFGEFWTDGLGLAMGAVGLPQNEQPGRTFVIDTLAAPPANLTDLSYCIEGAKRADFFGYTVIGGRFVGSPEQLAVGAIYANRFIAETDSTLTNAGAVYLFANLPAPDQWTAECNSLDPDAATSVEPSHTVWGSAIWDELGTALGIGNVEGRTTPTEYDDLLMTARWSDRTADYTQMTTDNIDEGATYVVFGGKSFGEWPESTDCVGTCSDPNPQNCPPADCDEWIPQGVDIMLLGGSFGEGESDEIGFSVAAGDYNLDSKDDIAVSSLTHNRVYVVSPLNTNETTTEPGQLDDLLRNIRDEDDDGDGYLDVQEDCDGSGGAVDATESDPLVPNRDAGVAITYTVVDPYDGLPQGIVPCDPVLDGGEDEGQIAVEIVVTNESPQLHIVDDQSALDVAYTVPPGEDRIYEFVPGSITYQFCSGDPVTCTDEETKMGNFPQPLVVDDNLLEVGDQVVYRFRMRVKEERSRTPNHEIVQAIVRNVPEELGDDHCDPSVVFPNVAEVEIPLRCPDLVTRKDGPLTANAGESFTYVIEVVNNGSIQALNVTVTDQIPNQFEIEDRGGCVEDPDTENLLTCSLDPLGPAEDQEIQIVVSVPDDQTEESGIENTATATSSNADLIPETNEDSATTSILATAILEITKTDNVAPGASVVAGRDQIEYTITVSNAGPSAAVNAQVQDTLPLDKVTFVDTDCANPGTGPADCNLGNIAPDESDFYKVVVSVNPDALGTIRNEATASSDTTPLEMNPTAAETTLTVGRANLELTMTDDVTPPDFPVAGEDEITYTLAVENLGDSWARSVLVRDSLPAGTAYVGHAGDASCDVSTVVEGAIDCELGDIAVNDKPEFSITVRTLPSAPASITNVATVSSDTIDEVPGNNDATQDTTVETSADLEAAIRLGDGLPDPIVAGRDSIAYIVTVTNYGPSDAQNVRAGAPLPAGTSFDSTTDCVNDPNGVPTCSLGTIPFNPDDPNDNSKTYLIVVDVNSDTTGTVTNTVTVDSDTPDPGPRPNTAFVDATVTALADLSVVKAALTDPATAGQQLTYRITVTNNGFSDAVDVTATDTLPGGVTFSATVGCENDPGGYPVCQLGTIPAAQSKSYDIIVDVLAATLGDLTNIVTVSSPTDPTDSSAIAQSEIEATADLGITLSDSADPVNAGATLIYTVLVNNFGPSNATSVVVNTTLSPEVTFVQTIGCGTPPPGDPNQVPPCDLGTIANGETGSFTIEVTVNTTAAATISSTVQVLSAAEDGNTGNNIATEPTTVGQAANLRMTKDDGDGTDDDLVVPPGGTIVYTNTVENIGTSDAINVRVTDALPLGVTLVPGSATAGCTEDPNGVPICSLGDIDAGESASYTITVTVDLDTLGEIRNTATVLSDTQEADPSDNTAFEDTLVATADLVMSKDDGDGMANDLVVAPGDTITYTLTVDNLGPSEAVDVQVVDQLPAGVTVTDGADCQEAPAGVLTCPFRTIANGDQATKQITVTVEMTTLGLLTNQATVGTLVTPDPNPGNDVASETTAVCDCSSLDDQCNVGVCDPATALCSAQPTNEGNPCDDGQFCTENDTCGGGSCVGTPFVPPSCDDGDVCTDDACDPAGDGGAGACTSTNNTAPCDDGQLCTENDTCGGGTCSGTPYFPPSCDDSNVCTNDACDPDGNGGAGACTNTDNTAPCDDGVFCNGDDTCGGGSCSVHEGDPCAVDEFCNEATESCDQCAADGDCDDSNPCTDDACVTGACQYTDNTDPCDDSQFCTDNDVCGGGTCSGTPFDPPSCDDTNICTDDACDPAGNGGAGACTNTNNTAPCDDSQFCTDNDVCGGGTCSGTPFVPPSCDDTNDCTDDACDPAGNGGAGACTNTNNTAPCDDGQFCTENDTCGGGTCSGTPFVPPSCDDTNACTDDACDPAGNGGTGACTNINNTDPCDDGQFCTENDTCGGGTCSGTPFVPPSCDDGEFCTADTCNPAANGGAGACENPPDNQGQPCDDGNPANDPDFCDAGICVGVGGPNPPSKGSPVANGGIDREVGVGTEVELDGSGSSDPELGMLFYDWSFVSKPMSSRAEIHEHGSASASFTPDVSGIYEVQLVVNNGLVFSEPDLVRFSTETGPPVADAGPDREVQVGVWVSLDGLGSSDPDEDALSCEWTLASVPAGSRSTLNQADCEIANFKPDLPGRYVVQMVARDGALESPPDTVTIEAARDTTKRIEPEGRAAPRFSGGRRR